MVKVVKVVSLPLRFGDRVSSVVIWITGYKVWVAYNMDIQKRMASMWNDGIGWDSMGSNRTGQNRTRHNQT